MYVEDGGSAHFASRSEDVFSVISATYFLEEGLEFGERLDEENRSPGESGVELGSRVGDADVNHGMRLEAETRELGESTGK
jgi:hypothetical protein